MTRQRTMLFSMLAAATLMMSACSAFDPPIPIDTDGDGTADTQMTAREADLWRERQAAKLKDEERREAAETAKAIAKAKRDATREAAKIDRQTADQQEAIAAQFEEVTEGLTLDLSTNSEARKASLARINATADEAMAEAQARAAAFTNVLGAVKNIPGVAAIPGINNLDSILAALGGIGVTAYMARRAKKREDQAWDEATAHAEKQVEKRDTSWDQSQLTTMLMQMAMTGKIGPQSAIVPAVVETRTAT